MTEQTSVSIVDIVSEGRYQTMFAVRTLFGINDLSTLVEFSPVILAMQGLPDQLIKDVGVPILEKFFEDEGLDPKDKFHRSLVAPFATIIAHNISNAAQAIYRGMQEQEAQRVNAEKRLSKGLLAF